MNEEFLNKSTKEEIIDMLVSQIDFTRELQNNWNELKKWLKEQYKLNDLIYYNDIDIVNPKKARIEHISKREELKEILDKMQELEGNNE